MNKPPDMDYELSLTLQYIMENPELLNAPESNDSEKDGKSKDKEQEALPDWSKAYLGPQLWDNMLASDDLKLEPVELNELTCAEVSTDNDVGDLALMMESAYYPPTTQQQQTPQLPKPVCHGGQQQQQYLEKEKKLEQEIPELSNAFLGPQLWDNMLLSDDLKLEPVEMHDMTNDINACNGGDLAMLMNSAKYSPSCQQNDINIPTSPHLAMPNYQQPGLTPYQHDVPTTQQSISQNGCLDPNNSYNNLQMSTSPEYFQNDLNLVGPQPTNNAVPQQCIGDPMTSPIVHGTVNTPLQVSPSTSPVRVPSPAKCDFRPSEADLLIATPKSEREGEIDSMKIYDPKTRKFEDDELKPQPIIRKAKKLYVNDDSKDNKYWARREKNNAAAKRSREARRVKENQIALRASFLEKENQSMKTEIASLRQELEKLIKIVKKYENGL